MKKYKIIFWATTIIIVLMEGVMPSLFSQSETAKEGIRHLQYPGYFGNFLVVFKIIGAITLLIPTKHWIKEWTYAGFAIDFVAAGISHGVIDGLGNFQTYFPLIFLVILLLSHYCYRNINFETRPQIIRSI